MAERRTRGPVRACDPGSGRRRLLRASWTVARAGRYGRLHRLAVDRLFAGEGEDVLDLGCGAGMNLGPLAGAVGREGRVVGVDARRGATRRARVEVAAIGDGCSVVRAGAGALPFGTAFDRAFSTLSVGAVPDVESAVGEVARVLRPGGRFVVLRARPLPTLPLAFLGPFGGPVVGRSSERDPDRGVASVRSLLEERFDTVHVETFGASAFVATAELSA